MKRLMRVFVPVMMAVAMILPLSGEAMARGAIIVGGAPYGYYYPHYYTYPYYYSPQPYYVYTPVYGDAQYAPPPVYSQNYAPTYCREYNRTVYIDGSPQTAFGNACLMPDGKWQFVN